MFYVPAISEDRFVEYFEIQIAQSDTTVITGLVGSQIKRFSIYSENIA